MVTFTVGWYEWDGKDGEGQKTNGSHSEMKAAGFKKAIYIYFNLQKVIVLYEPASVEELGLSITLSPDVLFNIFHWSLSILQYSARQ